jgi:hypothetical protein
MSINYRDPSHCEPVATQEMGRSELSLGVKNMTLFFLILEVTKSVYQKYDRTNLNVSLLLSF